MKKFLFALAVVLGLAVSAGAATITDTTLMTPSSTDPAEDFVSAGGTPMWLTDIDHIRWIHHFTPVVGTITSANIAIEINDDDGLDGTEWAGIASEERILLDLSEVDTAVYTFDIYDFSYLTDGQFEAAVASSVGDFYVIRSDLTINYTPAPPAPAVPIPAAVWLFGTGLLGLFGARRKIVK